MTESGGVRPVPALREVVSAAAAGLVVFWLPFAVVQQLDALRMFLTAGQILDDVARLAVLLGLVAGLLGFAAVAAGRAINMVVGSAAARAVAWSVVLVPVGLACAWQFAFGVKRWLEVAVGHRLSVGHVGKLLGLLALCAGVGWLVRRPWRSAWLGAVREALASVRWLAAALIAASVLGVLVRPPVIGREPRVRVGGALPVTGTARPPDVYLISIDSVSALDAAACKPGAGHMRALAKFAANAVCFDRMYAVSNFTNPTTSTIATGVLPWTHAATQVGASLEPWLRAASVSAALSRAGYRTISVNANVLASPRHHGTQRYYDVEEIARSTSLRSEFYAALTVLPDSSLPTFLYSTFSFLGTIDVWFQGSRNPYDPRSVYDEARRLLAAPHDARPQFVWLHTLPPHAPYLPPASTKHSLLADGTLERWAEFLPENSSYDEAQQPIVDRHRLRYQECLRWADAELGRFLDWLEATRRLDHAVVIVTADHGESFSGGYLGHAGPRLSEQLLRIPFVVRLPGQIAGLQIDEPVSQADVMPTILDLAGIQPAVGVEGRSLRAVLEGGVLESRPVFAMALETVSRFGPLTSGSAAVIDGTDKVVLDLANGQGHYVDLRADPGGVSLVPVADGRPARLLALLRERIAAADRLRALRD
jgi:arylsulfatase A-like enzyme